MEPNDAAPTQDTQQQQADDGQQQQHNKIQKRIDELWGQKKQAEEHASSLASEVESLRTQLAETQEKLNLLGVQRAGSDPLFPSSPAVPSSSGEDLEKVVRKVLGETVGPMMQGWQQQQKLAQLRAAQAQSFNRAKSEFSDLGDPNSPLFQAADEIIRRDRALNFDPDGPRKAAIMARGLLADTGQEVRPEARLAAAAQPPTASPGPSTAPKPAQEVETLRTELDQLYGQMKKPGQDLPALWAKRNELVQKIIQAEGRVGV